MAEDRARRVGRIVWTDLTVPDAAGVRDFYARVVGWTWKPHDMGEYEDYELQTADPGETVAGVCHARGSNADLPPYWLPYVEVDDVDLCARRAEEAGGSVVAGPRPMGGGRFCVVRDPAGAYLALFHPG